MRYGEVIERSLSIFWRHRYLWLLGALGGGEASGGGGFGNFGLSGQGSPGGGQASGDLGTQFTQWLTDNILLLVVLSTVLLLFFLVYFLVSCVATGAAIRAAAEHDAERPFGLRLAWRAGLQTFWSILGLRLLGLVLVLLAVALGGAVIAFGVFSAANQQPAGAVTAVLAGIVLLPTFVVLGIVLTLVWILALRSIVLEQHRVFEALGRGFHLVRHRLGRVLLVWLIAIGIGIVIGIGIGIAATLVALPLVAVAAATYATAGLGGALTIGAVLLAFYLVGVVAVGGAVGSFMTTYWTLAFRRLDLDPVPFAPVQQAPPGAWPA
jgi:hypothetical protein